ncbi:hypothetical protein ACF0H5_006444 [Mactra antiquata]
MSRRCGYNLMKLWTAEVAHTPFAASPLITDINADGKLNIVAAPLSESQTVLEAETGKTLPDSKWPTQKLDTSILSSPIQFDINNDGMLDIMFISFSGELTIYTPNGTLFKDKNFEIPPVHVQQYWYNDVISASGKDVYSYLKQSSTGKSDKTYLPVDAHVMATPVLADLNKDHRLEELVIPVSYFFDEEDYRLPEDFEHINNINTTDLGKYVISGITIVNLTSLELIHSIYLDLTMKSSGFPGYVLFSPTVIDMDRNGGYLEIIIGTSAGNVHVINVEDGVKDRPGFPYSMGIIHGQLTVADINKDDRLEIVVIDSSGNVVCLNDDGTLTWEITVSGDNSPGSRLHDIDEDGYLDIIIPTNVGDIYAINGVTGKVLDKWPIKVGHPILSNILITKISSIRKGLDIVFLSNDGALHIISTDQSCRTHFPIGETSLVQILSHDLVVQSEGLELLISTNDGTLICMGSGEETDVNVLQDAMYENILMLALTGDTKTSNDFTYAKEKFGIYVLESSRTWGEVTGSMFHIDFVIHDPSYLKSEHRRSLYTLTVYFGSHLLFRGVYSNPGFYSIFVDSYPRPSHGHITMVLSNKNGQIATDQFPIRFNQIILEDLQWLLMAPFVTMVIILLVNHGFPAKDLLPITLQSKDR